MAPTPVPEAPSALPVPPHRAAPAIGALFRGLTLPQVEQLTERLKSIAQRNQDTELANIVVALIATVAQLSLEFQSECERFTVSPSDYAQRHGMNLRTVQRHCRQGKIPAIRTDGRNWRIRNDDER